MAEVTRAAEVAAALDGWDALTKHIKWNDYGDTNIDLEEDDAVSIVQQGHEIARLLRESEVQDDGINFHEAFGSAVWESLKARWVQGEMSDDDINLMELAEEAGLCEQVAYSPEHHGEIQDAEPGDMIFWWGGR